MIQIKEIKQPPLLLALWKFSKFLSLQCLLYYWMIPFFPLGHFLSFNPSNNPLPENIKHLCRQVLRLFKFSMKITKHCLERYASLSFTVLLNSLGKRFCKQVSFKIHEGAFNYKTTFLIHEPILVKS